MDLPSVARPPLERRDSRVSALAARRPPSRHIGGPRNDEAFPELTPEEAARELRRRLVERIRNEIATGEYRTDARRVAEALVRARIPFLFGSDH